MISMEAGDASIEAHMQSGRLQLTCSVEDIAAHDLCTHGAGISEMLLTRWDKGICCSTVLLLQHHIIAFFLAS